jgi:hypothetical protein
MRWRPLYDHQGLSPRGSLHGPKSSIWEHRKQKSQGKGRGGQRLLLALPIRLFLAPSLLHAAGFRFPLSALRFQVSAFQLFASYPDVGIEFGYGEKLVAGLFDLVFHPQPVEQRALGLLLAGCGSDQAPNETRSNRRSALFPL